MSEELLSIGPTADAQDHLPSLLHSDSRHVYAYSNSRARLLAFPTKRKPASTDPETIYVCDPPLDFAVTHLSVSRGGQYIALAGSTQARPGAGSEPRLAVLDLTFAEPSATHRDVSVCKVQHRLEGAALRGSPVAKLSWHPDSDPHLALLTRDSCFRLLNTAKDPREVVEQELFLRGGGSSRRRARGRGIGLSYLEEEEEGQGGVGGARLVSFCFAPQAVGWARLSVFFLGADGTSHLLCPLAPRGARYPQPLIERLLSSVPDAAARDGITAAAAAARGRHLAGEGAQGAKGEGGGGLAARAEAWVGRAFSGGEAPQWSISPVNSFGLGGDGASYCTVMDPEGGGDPRWRPRLQGPLPSQNSPSPPSPPAASSDIAALCPSPDCVVLAAAAADGTLTTSVLAGQVGPCWDGPSPSPPPSALSTAAPSADAFRTPNRARDGFTVSTNPAFFERTPDMAAFKGAGRRGAGGAGGAASDTFSSFSNAPSARGFAPRLLLSGYEEASSPQAAGAFGSPSTAATSATAATAGVSQAIIPEPPTLVAIDCIPTREFRGAAALSSADPAGTGPTALVTHPALPDLLCVAGRAAVHVVQLTWLPHVAQFLRGAATSDMDGAEAALRDLPEPVVVEAVRHGASVVGAALVKGSLSTPTVVVAGADGRVLRAAVGLKPSSGVGAAPGVPGTPSGGPRKASAAASPLDAAAAHHAALEPLRRAAADYEADLGRVMADYDLVAAGPPAVPEPSKSGPDETEGPAAQKYLKEWSIYLQKRYSPYFAEASLIVASRSKEVQLVAADGEYTSRRVAERVAEARAAQARLKLRLGRAAELQARLVEHVATLREVLDSLPRRVSDEEKGLMVYVTEVDLDRRAAQKVRALVERVGLLWADEEEAKSRGQRSRATGGPRRTLDTGSVLRSLEASKRALSAAQGLMGRVGEAVAAVESGAEEERVGPNVEGGGRGRRRSGEFGVLLSATE